MRDRPGETRVRSLWPLLGALSAGVAMALQGAANGTLRNESGSALWPPLVSFGSALVVLLTLGLLVPVQRRTVRHLPSAVQRVRPRIALGVGLLAATFVCLQSGIVPLIGVALFTLGVVAGQSTASLLVDRIGLSGIRSQVTALRLAAAGLSIVSLLVAGAGDLQLGGAELAAALLAFAGGAVWAVQQAVQGRVQAGVGNAALPITVSFAGATLALGVLVLTGSALSSPPEVTVAPPLAHVGGLLGLYAATTVVLLVRRSSVLSVSLGVTAGQLVGSLVVDHVTGTHEPTAATWVAVVLALAAALLGARAPRVSPAGRSARR